MNRKITDNEFDYITDYLKSKGISDENVLSELTDHLVILTEVELNTEPEFEIAFSNALKKFNRKELIEISRSKEGFYLHPKFLNKNFLIIFGTTSLIIYCIGLYLRFNQLPLRKLFQLIGGLSFGYIFFGLLLLYWLTEYANKTKYILIFMTLFTAYHSGIGLLLNWQSAKFLSIVFIFFALLCIIYFIVANLKSKTKSS